MVADFNTKINPSTLTEVYDRFIFGCFTSIKKIFFFFIRIAPPKQQYEHDKKNYF